MENNERFYWIRLRTDFFSRNDIDFLLSQENGCEYVVLYQMLCLNTANTNGRLESSINEIIVPCDIEKIKRDTKYFNTDTILVALELYKKLGLIYTEKDGILKITEIERMVGSESGTRAAIKKREQRIQQKIREGTQKGTNCPIEIRDKRLYIRDYILKEEEINKEEEIFTYYQNNISSITPRQYEILNSYLETFNEEILKEAINRASDNNAKSFKYIEAILKSWKSKGYKTLGDVQSESKKKKVNEPEWLSKDLSKKEEKLSKEREEWMRENGFI